VLERAKVLEKSFANAAWQRQQPGESK